MKKLSMMLTIALASACAQAEGLIPFGDKIGNGGGLWACMKNGVLEKAELVDLFEARAEFQLNVPEPRGLGAEEIFEARKKWIEENFPWFFNELAFFFDYVARNRSLADGVLVPVDDSLYRLVPKAEDCSGGEWKYRQFANFTPLGQITAVPFGAQHKSRKA